MYWLITYIENPQSRAPETRNTVISDDTPAAWLASLLRQNGNESAVSTFALPITGEEYSRLSRVL